MKKWIYLTFTILSFILYGNTIQNDYSLDDSYITDNKFVQQGFVGIPSILTNRFGIEKLNIVLDYRPISLTSSAIEYQFFKKNPHVSHFINILLYAVILMVLYGVLTLVFKLDKINNWLPIAIVFFYAIHPLHTEVVASIKNRDELFSLLFGLLFLKYGYLYFTKTENKLKLAFATLLFFTLSLFSKSIGLAFFPMLILILLFYRLIKKTIWNYVFLLSIFTTLFLILYLNFHGLDKDTYVYENSLVGIKDLTIILPTCFKIIFYHLKMLVAPFPLRHYYGNNMFPLQSKLEITVILSFIIHISLLVIAIKKMIQKDILGLFIFCYLTCVLLYFNFPIPYTGMFSERALFVSSIWFIASIAVVVFRSKFMFENGIVNKLLKFVAIIFFIVFSFQTIQRNFYWKNFYTLATKDISNLENSINANYNYANLLTNISKETEDKVQAKEIALDAAKYFKNAINLYPYFPGYYLTYANLLNYQLGDKTDAINQYKKAIDLDSNDYKASYQIGKIYFEQNDFRNSYNFLQKAYDNNPNDSLILFYLAQNTMKVGDMKTSYKINKEFLDLYPELKYPYLNLGVYYSTISKDDSAVIYFEKAIALGDRNPDLLKNMVYYFDKKQNKEKSVYYESILQQIK